ncbi:MAG: hypothetical protein ACR2IK_08945 [Chloroflexota bacterium]
MTRTIVGEQLVSLSCGVQLLLDVDLIEYAGCEPTSERPGAAIQRVVPPTVLTRTVVID